MARGRYAAFIVLVLSLMLLVQVAQAAAYTITVSTDKPSYGPDQMIKITGTVTPAPGPSTAAFVKVVNPHGKIVFVWNAPVGATSGSFNSSLITGGTSDWVDGTYTVNATWGAFPPQIFHTAKFTYSTSTVTTTTTTSTSSSTSTTISSTTSSTSTSSTSSSTSTSTSSTSSTHSTSSSTSSSSSSSGGGIPEFPFQAGLMGVFAIVILTAYLLTRSSSGGVQGMPLVR